jgi:lipoprotein NlpD
MALRSSPVPASLVRALRLGLLPALLTFGGCHLSRAPMHPQTPAGSWYVVAPGETLADIAQRAGVPGEDILEPEASPSTGGPAPNHVVVSGEGGRLRWPLVNVAHAVGSPFGARDGRAHEGIDLPAPTGTPVIAAADGEVVYAGSGIRGYGNLVVLQHPGDLLTVYAHNSELFVALGQHVRAGDRIAAVGQTGRATGPHLHFEVRQGQIPRDPMSYLSAGGAP